jgi:DNA-binding NarL/FixJ family response regulator
MQQRRAMRILIADDDPVLLDATAECIAIERPGWTVLVAKDGLEALRLLREETVDILIADIEMPAMDGLSLLAEVRKDARLAALPMILATGRVDRASVRGGMASGADDYLTKPYTVDELIAAVEARLRRSQQGASSEDASQLRARLQQLLTERELEVLGLIGRGLVTKDIARKLALSPATVSVHRANIMEKLGLHNAAALAAMAERAGLT